MAPVFFDLRRIADPRDAVHRAVEGLAAGKIIAFPTETVYGIAVSALHGPSVRRLFEIKTQAEDIPLIFFVKSHDDALDYIPDMGPFARRLTRKCWPGPLTIFFRGPNADSVITRLPEDVQEMCTGTGWVGLRVPADPMALEILRLNAGPVVMTNSGSNQFEPAVKADELSHGAGKVVDLVLDGGVCRFSQPSTVIKIEGDQIEIVRRGVIDEQSLKRMSEKNILIVCTGNTCRSPMAEGLLKKRLATTFGCSIDGLPDVGFNIESAGVAAMPGGGVSTEAVEALRQRDVDISMHSSQPVTDRLIQQADLILTMTGSHRQALLAQWPAAANRTYTISYDQGDIADPIGLPAEYYEHCANQIDSSLEWWVKENQLFKRS